MSFTFIRFKSSLIMVNSVYKYLFIIISCLCNISLFAQVRPFDLVINELMIKPTPVVGMPPYEYIELFNRSDKDINISGWKLKIGDNEYDLPAYIITPHEFVIIVKKANEPYFDKYTNVITINSLSLNDDRQMLSLLDKNGTVISYFEYNMDYWSGESKSKGGWSLEQIDSNNPCGGVENWKFSTNRNGGTAASINAVAAENKDVESPRLIRALYIDESNISLLFNEPIMSPNDLTNVSTYFISHGIGTPKSATIIGGDNRIVMLDLGVNMQNGILYTLSVMNGTLCDCVGNMLTKDSKVEIGIPDEIGDNELLISEVMFSPSNNNTQWIELFNNSDKLFNLSNISIVIDDKTAYPEPFYLFPRQYIVLKKSMKSLGNYTVKYIDNILPIDELPSLNVNEGFVKVADKGDYTILFDEMHYNKNMHHPVIADKKGVSLERISMEMSAMDLSNWQSAGAIVDFATPTYENSIHLDYQKGEEQWTLSSEIFSPDNDGYEDILGINYELDEIGQTANINIYNQNGTLVRRLTNNLLLSSKGTILWNGMDDANRKVAIGIYIIDIKSVDLENKRSHKKLIVTVAAKL